MKNVNTPKTRKLILLAVILANIPVALVVFFMLFGNTKFSAQVNVDGKESAFYSNKSLVEQHYDRYVQLPERDREAFLAKVYEDIRYEDELRFIPYLRDFIIKVKISQFGK